MIPPSAPSENTKEYPTGAPGAILIETTSEYPKYATKIMTTKLLSSEPINYPSDYKVICPLV